MRSERREGNESCLSPCCAAEMAVVLIGAAVCAGCSDSQLMNGVLCCPECLVEYSREG